MKFGDVMCFCGQGKCRTVEKVFCVSSVKAASCQEESCDLMVRCLLMLKRWVVFRAQTRKCDACLSESVVSDKCICGGVELKTGLRVRLFSVCRVISA